jgi:hypothetical protein
MVGSPVRQSAVNSSEKIMIHYYTWMREAESNSTFIIPMLKLFLYSVFRGHVLIQVYWNTSSENHARDHMKLNARGFFIVFLVLAGSSFFGGLIGCSSPKPAEQAQPPSRYAMNGRVVSIDKAKQQVVVDAKDIPGFMGAMTMPYDVKNPSLMEPLSPEDQITADVVVNGNDVWLENIVVTKKPDQAKAPASNDAHPDSPPPAKH